MQLKEEFRTYETLRREHDAQIVQIATEAGLRIAPDQWSSLLYGNICPKLFIIFHNILHHYYQHYCSVQLVLK